MNLPIENVIITANAGRRGYIYYTAVHPDCRKQGIANALLTYAIDALKSHNINKVALVVFEKNVIGNAFWEQNGFTMREDLIYRNKTINEMTRIDT